MTSGRSRRIRVANILFSTLLIFIAYNGESQSAFAKQGSQNESRLSLLLKGLPDNSLKLPSPVGGLRVVSLDKNYRRIKLSWFANPLSEKVDKYAIYSEDAFKPPYLGMQLNGVTKGTSSTLAVWNSSAGKQTPHAVLMELGYFSEFWVIAHNQYGWGETAGGPYPENYNPKILTRSQQIANYPYLISQDWICTPAIKKYYAGQC